MVCEQHEGIFCDCKSNGTCTLKDPCTITLEQRLRDLQRGLQSELHRLDALIGTLPSLEKVAAPEDRLVASLAPPEQPYAVGPELRLSIPRRLTPPVAEHEATLTLMEPESSQGRPSTAALQGSRKRSWNGSLQRMGTNEWRRASADSRQAAPSLPMTELPITELEPCVLATTDPPSQFTQESSPPYRSLSDWPQDSSKPSVVTSTTSVAGAPTARKMTSRLQFGNSQTINYRSDMPQKESHVEQTHSPITSSASHILDSDDKAWMKTAKQVQLSEKQRAAGREQSDTSGGTLCKLVSSSGFESTFGAFILFSALLSGTEAQWMANNIGEDLPLIFFLVRLLLTLIFLVELILRICAQGAWQLLCAEESWYWGWLDMTVVCLSLVEVGFDILLLLDRNGQSNGVQSIGGLRIIRVIRITRLARAFRLQRIIRFIASLRTLVYSISVTLKSLFWAMVLLMMIVYVFAISFTQYASEYRAQANVDDVVSAALASYWGGLDRSMFTLFQTISGGLSWRDAVEPLEQVSIFPVILFTLYVSFTYFAVLNVVTGVFCSSAIETAQKNPDLVARSLVENQKSYANFLRTLFATIDKDNSGLITLDEFEMLMNDELMRAYFAALEIEFTDAWTLFRLIDADKGGAIEIEEFVRGCSQLRGGASSIQVASIGRELRNMGKKLVKFIMDTDEKLELLTAEHGVLRSQKTAAKMPADVM